MRRQGRRLDVREQLRIAHRMLKEMAMVAFAELAVTGETARERTTPDAPSPGPVPPLPRRGLTSRAGPGPAD